MAKTPNRESEFEQYERRVKRAIASAESLLALCMALGHRRGQLYSAELMFELGSELKAHKPTATQ
jgi:hypothetical protein